MNNKELLFLLKIFNEYINTNTYKNYNLNLINKSDIKNNKNLPELTTTYNKLLNIYYSNINELKHSNFNRLLLDPYFKDTKHNNMRYVESLKGYNHIYLYNNYNTIKNIYNMKELDKIIKLYFGSLLFKRRNKYSNIITSKPLIKYNNNEIVINLYYYNNIYKKYYLNNNNISKFKTLKKLVIDNYYNKLYNNNNEFNDNVINNRLFKYKVRKFLKRNILNKKRNKRNYVFKFIKKNVYKYENIIKLLNLRTENKNLYNKYATLIKLILKKRYIKYNTFTKKINKSHYNISQYYKSRIYKERVKEYMNNWKLLNNYSLKTHEKNNLFLNNLKKHNKIIFKKLNYSINEYKKLYPLYITLYKNSNNKNKNIINKLFNLKGIVNYTNILNNKYSLYKDIFYNIRTKENKNEILKLFEEISTKPELSTKLTYNYLNNTNTINNDLPIVNSNNKNKTILSKHFNNDKNLSKSNLNSKLDNKNDRVSRRKLNLRKVNNKNIFLKKNHINKYVLTNADKLLLLSNKYKYDELYYIFKQYKNIDLNQLNKNKLPFLSDYLESIFNKKVTINMINIKQKWLDSTILNHYISNYLWRLQRRSFYYVWSKIIGSNKNKNMNKYHSKNLQIYNPIFLNNVYTNMKLVEYYRYNNFLLNLNNKDYKYNIDKILDEKSCMLNKNSLKFKLKNLWTVGLKVFIKGRIITKKSVTRSKSSFYQKGSFTDYVTRNYKHPLNILRGHVKSNLDYNAISNVNINGTFNTKVIISTM